MAVGEQARAAFKLAALARHPARSRACNSGDLDVLETGVLASAGQST